MCDDVTRPHIRVRGSREQRRCILIVTEGAKTEPKYFCSLRQNLKLTATTVQVVPADATDPAGIVEFARSCHEARASGARAGYGVAYDETWVVFDSEQRLDTPQLNDALDRARSLKIRVAMSAPCFEYWLLLHHTYSTRYMCSYREAQEALRRHIPHYDKTNPPVDDLWPRVPDAVNNAALCRQNCEPPRTYPFTDVDHLVGALDAAAAEDYRILGRDYEGAEVGTAGVTGD